MPRGRDRYEVRDFSYGMDSTSYPGVIADEKARMPTLYNWRIRENGRLIRRGGYKKLTTDTLPTSLVQADIQQAITIKGTMEEPAYQQKAVFFSTADQKYYRLIPATGILTQLTDPVGSAFINHNSGNNFVTDANGHIYTAGEFDNTGTIYPSIAIRGGGIIDIASSTKIRNWGIATPRAAAVVTLTTGSAINDIPAPIATTDTGWFYFYTSDIS